MSDRSAPKQSQVAVHVDRKAAHSTVVSEEFPEVPQQVFKVDQFSFQFGVGLTIVFSAIVVGLEIDYRSKFPGYMFSFLHGFFCVAYVFELTIRIVSHLSKGLSLWRWFHNLVNMLDMLVVVIMVFGLVSCSSESCNFQVFRLSIFRCLRFLWVVKLARNKTALHELWMVLAGLARASRSVAWLALVLLVTFYAVGNCVMSMLSTGSHDGDLYCSSVGERLRCLGRDEYFGSTVRSILTLLQIATMDGWASRVVRQVMDSQPEVAVLLTVFVVVIGYGLFNVVVALMVWSTVDLARSHTDHNTHRIATENKRTIALLYDYFMVTLPHNRRGVMYLHELQAAMDAPQVAHAFEQLDLPISDINELFRYLDKTNQGFISLDELVEGCLALKRPASRVDMMRFTARLGNSVRRASSLEGRAEANRQRLCGLTKNLQAMMTEVREYSYVLAHRIPEVELRRQGKIVESPPHSFQNLSW